MLIIFFILLFLHYRILIDRPLFGRCWARSWCSAHKIIALRGRQTLNTHTNTCQHNGMKGMPCVRGYNRRGRWSGKPDAGQLGKGGGEGGSRQILWGEGESRLVAGKGGCHTKQCQKIQGAEGLFSLGQMVHIFSTQTNPFLIRWKHPRLDDTAHMFT